MEEPGTRSAVARVLKESFLQALQCNDFEKVRDILQNSAVDINTVFEVEDKNMILASYKQGYWLPGYKLESSWATGLHLCVMYGFVETALVLLEHKASLNGKPNGKTPLHVACEVSNSDCVAVLLSHGARVNSISLSGHAPLHYCITKASVDCAKQLILKGADLSKQSDNVDGDTPLHTAARFGVPELTALYLTHGARVDEVNAHTETPLITAAFWALNFREQEYSADHHLVCRLLLDSRANVNLQEQDLKTALHKAAWNCDHVLMEMLLEAGADSRVMDINGCAPIQYLIKVTSKSHRFTTSTIQDLYIYCFFEQVLQACHECPRAIEVMINSYEHIKATDKWRRAIPDTVYQQHQVFYESVFTVCRRTPRALMHLARCAIRAAMLMRCHQGVRKLSLPPSLERYLLLEPEGILY
ncbi:ASB4 protein, partial [Amia calva]|nr:ASB4 protein [Amia calva]